MSTRPCDTCGGSGAVSTPGRYYCRICLREYGDAERAAAGVVQPCTHVVNHMAYGVRCKTCGGRGEVEQEAPAAAIVTAAAVPAAVSPASAPPAELRLSPEQQRLLLDVWTRQGEAESVPWSPGEGRSVWGAVQKASLSRSLRRLEERGYLRRVRLAGKTTAVAVTAEGRAVAEGLMAAKESR